MVGNVLIGSPNSTDVEWSVEQSLIHGNYEAGAVRWDPGITVTAIQPSYYLDAAPNFYGGSAWPSIGPESGASCTNPARQRFESGSPMP